MCFLAGGLEQMDEGALKPDLAGIGSGGMEVHPHTALQASSGASDERGMQAVPRKSPGSLGLPPLYRPPPPLGRERAEALGL